MQIGTSPEFDAELRRSRGISVCGVDEAGRGAWAGPLVAAAVVLTPDFSCPQLGDSKEMTDHAREEAYCAIVEGAVYSVQFVEPTEIDTRGLTWANCFAMEEAARKVAALAGDCVFVVDQSPATDFPGEMLKMPRAESVSLATAAASVLAKVSRDRHMNSLDNIYPEYRLSETKGYINQAHKEAVREHGRREGLHRMSYKVADLERFRRYDLFE